MIRAARWQRAAGITAAAVLTAGRLALGGDAADLNIAVNPKDIPDLVGQEDTVADGATWSPVLHGYPHASADSRLDRNHDESKMIDGSPLTAWVSGAGGTGSVHTVTIDLGRKRSLSGFKLVGAQTDATPSAFTFEISSDDFRKDVRRVFRVSRDGPAHWNRTLSFRPAGARFIRLTAPAGPGGTLAIGEFELYETKASPAAGAVSGSASLPETDAFVYTNAANLAFNPRDVPDGEWEPAVHGYPHATASDHARGRPFTASYPPCYAIDGDYNAARSWSLPFDKWWGTWIKVDFGRPTVFRYLKVFSSSMWIRNGETNCVYQPGAFRIEVSDDDFRAHTQEVFAAKGGQVDAVWNSRRQDTAKALDLGQAVTARYVRLQFPEGQYPPHRLLIDELEVYRDPPPAGKTPRVVTRKPALGGTVAAPILADGADYTLWLEGSTRKVFKADRVAPGATPEPTIAIAAARGECEPFQLVVTPKRTFRGLRLRAEDLCSGVHRLPAACVQVEEVGYVYIFDPSYVHGGTGSAGLDGQTGDWPDPLLRMDHLDVSELRNYPLWVTVRVPEDAVAGVYTGRLVLAAEDVPETAIALRVNVRDFAIPPAARAHYILGAQPSPRAVLPYFRSYFGNKWTDARIMRAVFDVLSEYRFNALFADVVPDSAQVKVDVSAEGDSVSIDTAAFDAYMQYPLDGLGWQMAPFPLAIGFSDTFGSRRGADWRGLPYMSAAYQKALFGPQGYLAQMAAHLGSRGWLDKFLLNVVHEPQCAQKGFDGWGDAYRLATMVQGVNGHIRMKLDGVCLELNPVQELPRMMDGLGVYPSGCSTEEVRELRESRGTKVYSEYNAFSLIDFPAVHSRVIPWLFWKLYGGDGHFKYNIFSWISPWESSRSMPSCVTSGSIRNGDDVYIYPMPGSDTNAVEPYVMGCMRLALEREGAEDFEYLWLLNDRIRRVEQGSPSPRAAAAAAQARRVLDETVARIVPAYGPAGEGAPWERRFAQDPAAYYAAREACAAQIEALGGK